MLEHSYHQILWAAVCPHRTAARPFAKRAKSNSVTDTDSETNFVTIMFNSCHTKEPGWALKSFGKGYWQIGGTPCLKKKLLN